MSALLGHKAASISRRTLMRVAPRMGRAYATELPPSGKLPPNPREKRYEQKNIVFGVAGIAALLCAYYISTRPKERKVEASKNSEERNRGANTGH
ncbi:hypothetical protein H2248_010430 [Termitomyces sp. 'cryptogamus']|nr:hypothetical protein H2248_010430 [Termitomyces sp. 'cryptogamus']